MYTFVSASSPRYALLEVGCAVSCGSGCNVHIRTHAQNITRDDNDGVLTNRPAHDEAIASRIHWGPHGQYQCHQTQRLPSWMQFFPNKAEPCCVRLLEDNQTRYAHTCSVSLAPCHT